MNGEIPRVMLIPDTIAWILGTWAKEIVRWNSDRFDFLVFPYGEINKQKDLFDRAIRETDVVHCLSQSVYPKVHERIKKNLRKESIIISSVHHVVQSESIHECLLADRIMVVCREFMEQLLGEGVPSDCITLVYNGVDTDFFCPSDKLAARNTLGIDPARPVLGFSAKASSDHDGRKGIDVFKATIDRLKGLSLPLDIVISGPGWQRLYKELRGGSVRVKYFEYLERDQMPAYYNSLDLYLTTANVEGGPVPPLEAMSCGKTIISTSVGTIRDFVNDGVNGLLVPKGDPVATAEAVVRGISDQNLRQAIGKRARETILKYLQWRDTVGKIDPLYETSRITDWSYRRMSRNEFLGCSDQLIARDYERWTQAISRSQSESTMSVRLARQIWHYLRKLGLHARARSQR